MNRVLGAIGWFVLGALYGFAATLGHSARAQVGQLTVPWGLLVSLTGSFALLVSVRLLAKWRMSATFVALGLITSVSVLATGLGNSSVLIADSITGLVWLFSPVVAMLLVVLWPERSGNSASSSVD